MKTIYLQSEYEITKEKFKEFAEDKFPEHILLGEIEFGKTKSGRFYAKQICELK